MWKEIFLICILLLLIFGSLFFYNSHPSKHPKKYRNDIYGKKRGCEKSIDFVVTWVDSEDEKWKCKKEKWIDVSKSDSLRFGKDGLSQLELACSVHSILKYASWCRYVWIVTDNQIPLFVKDLRGNDKYKVRIIDHKSIIAKHNLPTFNSHAIESHLHNIEGLSERFIYMNDDMYFTKKVSPYHFFEDSKPLWRTTLMMNRKRVGYLCSLLDDNSNTFLDICSNVSHLCNNNHLIWRYTHHSVPLTRQLFLTTDKIYGSCEKLVTDRKRNVNQPPPIHLVVMLGYLNKLGLIYEPKPYTNHKYYYSKYYEKCDMIKAYNKKYHEVCINNLEDKESAIKFLNLLKCRQ